MTRHGATRAVADAGGSTGLATVVLALLSAGALAGLGMVGASQLTPSVPDQPRATAQAVEPPASVVVVTPRRTPGPAPAGATTPTPTPAHSVQGVLPSPAVTTTPPSPSHTPPAGRPPTPAGPALPTFVSPSVPSPSGSEDLGRTRGKPATSGPPSSRPVASSLVALGPTVSASPSALASPRGYGKGQGMPHFDRSQKPGNGPWPRGRNLL